MKDLKSLNVASPDFFKGMDAQLKSVPVSDWKTYLRWQLAHHAAPYLSSAFVNENFNFFRKQLYGAKELAPRWKRCTNYVDRDLGEALGKVYVSRVFTPDTKERTTKMVREIEDAMGRDVESLSWMSDATKKQALVKLHAVANKIGYPTSGATTQALPSRAATCSVTLSAARCLSSTGNWPALVSLSTEASGHDAANGQCRIQPQHERHQFSRWDPAAAVLRSQARRCA